MSSPALSKPLPRGARAGRPRAWADCPRCGEHWLAGSPYCVNCGWTPDGNGAAADSAAHPRTVRGLALPWLAAGLVTVLLLLLWAMAGDGDAASTTPAAASVQAEPMAQAGAMAVAQAASSPPAPVVPTAPPAATPPPRAEPPRRSDDGPDAARQAESFVRDWLAAEAGAAVDPSALRDFYADAVAYRGRPAAGWTVIAADKARYMQRWPRRHYELLSLSELDADRADGRWRAALHLRWQLESQQGHWRRGESVTLLGLRRIDGRWRIVAEGAGGTRHRPVAPAVPG